MSDSLKADEARQQPPVNSARLAMRALGWCLLGIISGAIAGLLLLPWLVQIVAGPKYELRAWDGQAIGSVAGFLVELFIVLWESPATHHTLRESPPATP